MDITSSDLLLIIDVQNDFCEGGALAVPAGNTVVPLINDLQKHFSHVVVTQDWHPAGHSSFASTHSDSEPFSTINLSYGEQTLWPDHCIQGSEGAKLHPQLSTDAASMIIRKGMNPAIDSYSAFYENDRTTSTGLSGYLRQLGVQRVFCVGLAFDYCVRYSANDAVREGFDTVVIEDACKAIDLNNSANETRSELHNNKIACIQSHDLA